MQPARDEPDAEPQRGATGDDILVSVGCTLVPTPRALAIRDQARSYGNGPFTACQCGSLAGWYAGRR